RPQRELPHAALQILHHQTLTIDLPPAILNLEIPRLVTEPSAPLRLLQFHLGHPHSILGALVIHLIEQPVTPHLLPPLDTPPPRASFTLCSSAWFGCRVERPVRDSSDSRDWRRDCSCLRELSKSGLEILAST